MIIPWRYHLLFWVCVVVFFCLSLWLFQGVLTPFVLGIAIAYLLDPIIEKMVTWKIPRIIAVLSILLLFLVGVVMAVILGMPPLIRQLTALAEKSPDYIEAFLQWITPYLERVQAQLSGDYLTDMKKFVTDNISSVLSMSGNVAGHLANGGQAILGGVTLMVITPLVAFFMLLEWPKVTAWIDDLIPQGNRQTIKGLLTDMNNKISGFVRGQISICFILAIAYAAALSIAGLNYGFLIGIMAGLLSIVPMVGSTLGLLVSVGVAWFQSGDLIFTGIIAGIFIAGQVIEGNVLTPKLLGDSVGLHPLWILFALMAGGSLLGIMGMMLAVPVAAVIGVLLNFAIIEYKQSRFYLDKKTPDTPS